MGGRKNSIYIMRGGERGGGGDRETDRKERVCEEAKANKVEYSAYYERKGRGG